MKKLFLSSVFAILTVFSLLPKAHAQEFCALGSYVAGEEISAYIALVPSEAEVRAEGLPKGLELTEIPGDDGKHLSLEGRAMTAGDLSFTVLVSQEPGTINCSAYFAPALPELSVSGDVSCAVNENVELYVSATVHDGGSLSYQWYSGAGFASVPINGANSDSYRPDTSQPGQQSYYCEVTNSNNGLSCSAVSNVVFVNVAEPKLTGIEVNSLPEKLLYAPGDSPDTTGLSLQLSYDNNSSSVTDHDFEVYPAVFDHPGPQLVEVRYKGFRCYFEVEVKLSAAAIEGIGVLSLPDKTEYEAGQSIDTSGLVIRVYTKNGHSDIDNGFEISPQVLRNEGRQSVNVSFEGKSCSFTVNVVDGNKLKSIAIASLPTRREYSVGDTVDVSGLSLQLIYGGRTELKTSGFDWSPKELTKSGNQEITLSYEGHSTAFTINVKEKAPEPSPSAKPVVTTAPGTAAPSATPAAVDRDHQARDVSALVKIIFVVAIFSLIGLAGYILYMQKRGRR